jgi:hypothetical protein
MSYTHPGSGYYVIGCLLYEMEYICASHTLGINKLTKLATSQWFLTGATTAAILRTVSANVPQKITIMGLTKNTLRMQDQSLIKQRTMGSRTASPQHRPITETRSEGITSQRSSKKSVSQWQKQMTMACHCTSHTQISSRCCTVQHPPQPDPRQLQL